MFSFCFNVVTAAATFLIDRWQWRAKSDRKVDSAIQTAEPPNQDLQEPNPARSQIVPESIFGENHKEDRVPIEPQDGSQALSPYMCEGKWGVQPNNRKFIFDFDDIIFYHDKVVLLQHRYKCKYKGMMSNLWWTTIQKFYHTHPTLSPNYFGKVSNVICIKRHGLKIINFQAYSRITHSTTTLLKENILERKTQTTQTCFELDENGRCCRTENTESDTLKIPVITQVFPGPFSGFFHLFDWQQ